MVSVLVIVSLLSGDKRQESLKEKLVKMVKLYGEWCCKDDFNEDGVWMCNQTDSRLKYWDMELFAILLYAHSKIALSSDGKGEH